VEGQTELNSRGAFPEIEVFEAELVDVGLRIGRIRELDNGHTYVRIATFVLPDFTVVPGGYPNWHVPIDDSRHWKYTFTVDREKALDPKLIEERRSQMDDDYRPHRNRANRYLQDRDSMRVESYCGIGLNFQIQDVCATEGMGPIQDRSQEHLEASDAPIVISRKILTKAIRDVQEGKDPPGVVRDPAKNRFPGVIGTNGVLPKGMDWKAYCKSLEEKTGK
ncbi:MAG: hypothetical protein GTO40_29955, partial [Deltaproteobacteria bacterium]|nr:hypothetical protein [Deltaproteobacteria bacterium]